MTDKGYIMALELEILDKCTLKQACEYIAYGWEPMLPIYENAAERTATYAGMDIIKMAKDPDVYENRMIKAANKLLVILYQGNITARGIPNFEHKVYCETDISAKAEFASVQLTYKHNKTLMSIGTPQDYIDKTGKIEIQHISDNTKIDYSRNHINTGSILYTKVEIDFDELQNALDPTTKSPIKSRKKNKKNLEYTTPYIEVMLEVIEGENLSKTNQSKAEYLTKIITQKLEERKITVSERLARAMATLIRLPESQGGKNKKFNK